MLKLQYLMGRLQLAGDPGRGITKPEHAVENHRSRAWELTEERGRQVRGGGKGTGGQAGERAEQRGTSKVVWLQLLMPALQPGPQGTYGRIKRILFTFMHEHKNLIYYSPVPRD